MDILDQPPPAGNSKERAAPTRADKASTDTRFDFQTTEPGPVLRTTQWAVDNGWLVQAHQRRVGPLGPPTQEKIRAMSEVNPATGCWEWKLTRHASGYGRYGRRYAHIVSHEVFKGPTNGLEVRHGCDNPCCVNPDHLSLGTHLQNMADRRERGRTARGERARHAKLTPDDVREIRRLRGEGFSQRKIAKRFGVSQFPIRSILSGKAWSHV